MSLVALLTAHYSKQLGRNGIRLFSSSSTFSDPLKFCVVGSGPAGFYTVDKILKRFQGSQVDILESLPTPFGLVRSGVAPDHPDTKNVINQFAETAKNERVKFFGNVRVGRDVSINELRSMYNAIVLAYGAESDRRLGVPGDHVPGVFPAREFVQWYNGHPSAVSLPLTSFSSITSVAICGLGNVALDIARVLLQPIDRLAATDAASHAVDALRSSAIRDVHLIGRRGPAQAAFTPKELRELVSMDGVAVKIHPDGCLNLSPACLEEIKDNRIKRRVVEVLTKASATAESSTNVDVHSNNNKTLHFHFYRSPVKILESEDNRVSGITLEETQLVQEATGAGQKAVGTGRTEDLKAQLVLESIGYKSCAIEGVPFDNRRGIIPNRLGQVIVPQEDGDEVMSGVFVCGWVKRGPSGIIGTNLVDAEQTVDTMVQQQSSFITSSPPSPSSDRKNGRDGLEALLADRHVQVVDFNGWELIDSEEVHRGAEKGKPREKIADVEEMLKIAHRTVYT